MSATPLSDLKLQEYWTAHEAHLVLGVPEKALLSALATKTLTAYYFGSTRQKVNAEEARQWAHNAPNREGGQWL
jgi:hypothetical protein